MTVKHEHLWRNDITGLRALAVLPVLIYHGFPGLIPGGFFGVDVFFVISGYLISGIIFRALQKDCFSYRNFYEKRIKRILPNLLILLAFVALVGYVILLDMEYRNLGQHIASSAAFFQNVNLLLEIDYFTEDALRKPLLHLWSLAIEEQFYILFPIVCSVLWKCKRSVKAIGYTVLAITVASFVGALCLSDKGFAFYFPFTRFWEMGVGIVLAYVETFGLLRTRSITVGVRHVFSVAGFLMVLASMFCYTKDMAHPGVFTLLPVLGSFLLIAACPDAVINRTVLSCAPMTFVGLISYSLYLWHWPLLAFVFMSVPEAGDWMIATALILSFVLAVLVYYFVENPVRISKGWGRFSTTILLLVGLVFAFAVGIGIKKMDGLPDRAINRAHPELSQLREGGIDWDAMPTIAYGNSSVHVTDAARFPSIVFAGDSHLEQYHLRIKRLSRDHHVSTAMIASPGCFIFNDVQDKDKCKRNVETFYKLIEDPRIKTLAVTNKWGDRLGNAEAVRVGFDRFKRALKTRPDLKVYVLLDAPWDEGVNGKQGSFDPYKHFFRFDSKPEHFVRPYPKMNLWRLGNDVAVRELSDVATVISIEEHVCPDGKCNLLKWYRDDDHLQPRRLETDATWLDPVFESVKR